MQRRLVPASALFIVLWLSACLCHGEDVTTSSTAYVAAAGAADGYSSLLAALQNQQITRIVLATNYTAGDDFEPFSDKPISVERNVTITGLPGTIPLLDLNRRAGVVQLCSTCTLRLANISLANLTRSGAGMVTFFRGQLGARLLQENGFSVRLVCQRTDVEREQVNQTQRSSRFPSPPGGQQLARSVNATYLGRSFPDAFLIEDVSLDVPLTVVRPGVYSGGFAVQWLNMTRACWSFVDEDCVERETSAEVCIAQQTQRLLAAAAGSSGGGGAKRAAAIAVPVAVVGALLLAALALLLQKRRRHRQRTTLLPKAVTQHSDSTVFTELPADGNMHSGSLHSAPNASGLSFSSSAHTHHSSPHAHSGPHLHSGPCASIAGTISAMVPLAAQGGWQLTSSRTSQGLQAAADTEGSSIEWGELLGAGSFGRVYKCRWAGMDVAVKVIQHDASALEAVENEVQLQMYLNHPNIVRAFHYITHTRKPSSPTSHNDANSGARAGGGLAATLMTGSGSGRRSSPGDAPTFLSNSSATDTFSSSRGAAVAVVPAQRSPSWVQSHLLSPETPKVNLQRLAPGSFSEMESGAGFTAATNASFAPSSSAATLQSPSSPDVDGMGVRSSSGMAVRGAAAAAAAAAPAGPARVVEFEQANAGPDYMRRSQLPAAQRTAAAAAAAAASPRAAAAPSSEAGYSSNSSSDGSSNPVSNGRATSSNGGTSSNEALGAPPGWPILMLDQPLSGNTGPGTAAGLHTLGTLAMRLGASGAVGSSSGGMRRGIGSGVVEKKLRFKSAQISETWLVQELCDCGTLASIAANYWRRETEDEVQMLQRLLLLRDVAAGMEFLHSKNIVHSDLNANNVLVSSCEASPNGLVAKLADLGLSRVINQHRTHRTTHTFGTLSHMPPCLLREGRLTTRADVYAFAMVMWQLFTGEPAWHGLHYGQFFQKVVLEHSRPPIPPDMPEDYRCLMMHCWAEEPNDRPTAAVVAHCLGLMIAQRLRLLEGEEGEAAAAAAAVDGGVGGVGGGVGDGAALDKRRSLEAHVSKEAAAAAVAAAAAAAVEQAVEAAECSSPVQ
ncbi:hypothetical protein OEZ85_007362 [Tetradesmus obliquus]|uniref:Protein kinase domain-containing protein n=1 Tax=Tetradesmus obliquus TaxID=3088 RepID=A0ABY8TXD8_TETOB|nr:hypothetical protein OEZ85_007362 [Tetradesmus obliquus]